MARHCYVVSCSQGDYQLQRKWKGVKCEHHGVFHGDPPCDCDPPFRLFPFPGKVKAPGKRQMWLKAINRADPKKPHTWLEPSRSQVVCSIHFHDGFPSDQHPYPELHLGHTPRKRAVDSEMKKNRKRRFIKRERKNEDIVVATVVTKEEPIIQRRMSPIGLNFIIYMLMAVVKRLREENATIKKEKLNLIRQMHEMKTKKSAKPIIQTTHASKVLHKDSDVNFFTGIGTLSLFRKLHDHVAPFVRRRWKGMKMRTIGTRIRQFNGIPRKFGPQRKLKSVDEFLLTLMKLRLGLLNQDLAKRFDISSTLVSQIFNSWLATMFIFLGKAVVWPTKEQVICSKPNRFAKLPDLRCIIDCSDIFIETPKDPNLQNATWSNYKHHNTIKFLVAIAPNSAITFLSPMYGGRTSDKEITLDSGFLDKCESYDMIQADKGFNIQEECDARLLSLHVPPGKRVQMTCVAVEKTKRIANLRILVEQVIRRLKTFRILSGQLPITLLPCIEKIVCVCASLCNHKVPIYKD